MFTTSETIYTVYEIVHYK